MDNFNYQNSETISQKGGKIVRKVTIKKGKGFKSVTTYRKGKKTKTVKKPLHNHHIQQIKMRKFIPGLFSDCKNCKTKKRKGGENKYPRDIETGAENETTDYIKAIPPDPERFQRYQQKMVEESFKSQPKGTAAELFDKPTPEEREQLEREAMMDQDPQYKEPFQAEELQIFSKGGKTKKNRVKR